MHHAGYGNTRSTHFHNSTLRGRTCTMNIHGYHRLSRYIRTFICLIIDSATVVPQQHKRCHGHASWSDIGYFVSYQLTSEFYESLAIRKTRITETTLCARLVSRDVTTRCATKCLIRCTNSEMVAFMHTIQGEPTHTASVDQDAQPVSSHKRRSHSSHLFTCS